MGDMTGEPKESKEQREASAANTEATQREAAEYWGYLLQPDKCGTPLLDRLLKGIAEVIVSWAQLQHGLLLHSRTDAIVAEHQV